MSVTEEWRKLHDEDLNNLYCSPNIVWVIKSRRMRWAGHVVQLGERRGINGVLVEKPERKRPLGRPRHGWEDNINTLRTGAFKLFKRPFPGFNPRKSTFILCFFKNL